MTGAICSPSSFIWLLSMFLFGPGFETKGKDLPASLECLSLLSPREVHMLCHWREHIKRQHQLEMKGISTSSTPLQQLWSAPAIFLHWIFTLFLSASLWECAYSPTTLQRTREKLDEQFSDRMLFVSPLTMAGLSGPVLSPWGWAVLLLANSDQASQD